MVRRGLTYQEVAVKKTLIRGVIVAALTLSGSAAMATTASAARSDCPAGYACAWQHENFTGRMIAMRSGAGNFVTDFSSNFNDQATSVLNRTNTTFCFFTDINGRGTKYSVPAGYERHNLGSLNDTFSSGYSHRYFPGKC